MRSLSNSLVVSELLSRFSAETAPSSEIILQRLFSFLVLHPAPRTCRSHMPPRASRSSVADRAIRRPFYRLPWPNAQRRRCPRTRATTVTGLKLKASYASTEGKLADSIVEDIMRL